MMLFISDMAGHLFLVILLFDTFQYIKGQDHPQLTVSSTVIRERESVQLSCETPPSLYVSHCYFYIEGVKNLPDSSCTQTITGTELLKRAESTIPAVVKVKCYYAIGKSHISPFSDPVSVTVQDPKPDITVHFDGYFNIICLIPGSVSPDTTCNLYVGEESQPSFTAKIKKTKAPSASDNWFCQFFVTESDLIRRLQSVRRKEVSCDYRVSSGPNSLSPHSDGYRFTDLVGVHISDPTIIQTPSIAGGQSTTESDVESNSQESILVAQLWQAAVGVASGVCVFLVGLTAVCLCRRTKKNNSQRPTARQDDHSQYDLVSMGVVSSGGMVDSGDAGIYCLITSVQSTFMPSGPIDVDTQPFAKEDSDTYHVYSSIPDRPATSAQLDGFYSLQTH